MKTRLNYYEPFGIGFNTIFNKLDNMVETTNTSYPPYNIIKDGENAFKIEIAVAGFKKEDISIKVDNGTLNISVGKRNDEMTEYLHHGISARSFNRAFTLAEHVEVCSAKQDDGILSISLVKNIPEEKLPKVIRIE